MSQDELDALRAEVADPQSQAHLAELYERAWALADQAEAHGRGEIFYGALDEISQLISLHPLPLEDRSHREWKE